MVMHERVTGHPPYQNGYQALSQRPPLPTRQFPTGMPAPQPMPAMPLGPSLPPVPRRNRRRTAVVLAALAAAFLVTAGVFAALFVAAAGDHEDAVARADQRRGELADLADRVSASEAERQRTEQRNTGLESENADLTECVDAIRHYLSDGLTDAQAVTALDAAFVACE
jgi:hypothetical protein